MLIFANVIDNRFVSLLKIDNMINGLFEKFANCVSSPYDKRIVIETNAITEYGENKYYMVDFNSMSNNNIYYTGDNGTMVFVYSNDNEDGEMFDTYEKGWNAVKNLALNDNVTKVYVEGY